MSQYITLLKFTDQGIKNISKSPTRARQFKQLAEKSGVKVVAQYWTTGRYDGLVILEADDEAKVFSLLAKLASLGNVRAESARAFPEAEFASILGK